MGHALTYVANCSCIEEKSKYPSPYRFSFDGMKEDPHNRELFESNEIKTSKYTWYTFLPSKAAPTQRPCCCSSTAWPTSTSS